MSNFGGFGYGGLGSGGGSIWGNAAREQQRRDYEQQQQISQQSGAPFAPYYLPGSGWYPDANMTWTRDHRIDPNTGDVIGPYPLPPADVALGFQAEHNRVMWRLREQRMRDALAYGRGGLALMQSYRPGGSAAIQSGQYQSLAQIQLNRANMTQPMDLLGDYRRHEAAKAGSSSEQGKQNTVNWILGGVAAIASIYTGGATAGLAADRLTAAGQGTWGDNSAGAAEAAGWEQAQGSVWDPDSPAGQYGEMWTNKVASDMFSRGELPVTNPQGQYGGWNLPSGQGGSTAPATLGPSVSPGQPQGAPPQQGGKKPGQQGSGAGPGEPGGMGMGAPGIGTGGDYSPVAHGAYAAAQRQDPGVDYAMMDILVDRYESDPWYQAFDYSVDREMQLRLSA